MTKCKLNLIAAACANMGIGINGTLPWKLKKEMSYFTSMTSQVKDPTKLNAVFMGRNTWDCIPLKYRPLIGRLNVVLTHHVNEVQQRVPEGVVVVGSLDEAIEYIENRNDVESTWVIGGSSVYKAAMNHQNCGKIYLTEIQNVFECDTFFPSIDKNQFKLITENGISEELQKEGDVTYYYRIYQKI